MTDWETRLRLALTSTDTKAITRLEKSRERLYFKWQGYHHKANQVDNEREELRRKIKTIQDKALARYTKRCPHSDIVGPYECSRDDCSGSHFRCRDCGKSGFSHEEVKAK